VRNVDRNGGPYSVAYTANNTTCTNTSYGSGNRSSGGGDGAITDGLNTSAPPRRDVTSSRRRRTKSRSRFHIGWPHQNCMGRRRSTLAQA
jgi:hypothetical protein